MFKHLLDRLAEPSTWAGLAAVVVGVGQVAKIDEAPAVAQAVGQAGEVAASNGVISGLVALGLGVVAIIAKEKGGK